MWNNTYNQYPYTTPYNPLYQQQQMPSNTFQYQQNQTGQGKNNIIWVKGKEDAKAMQLQPNSIVILLDSETNKFYIKTTDQIGLGKLRVFEYNEKEEGVTPYSQEVDLSNYVTKQQLQEILAKEGEKHEQFVSIADKNKSNKQQSSAINQFI